MWNTVSIIHRCKDISTVLTQTLVPGPSQMRGMRHGFFLQRREGQVAAGHVAGSIGRMQLELGGGVALGEFLETLSLQKNHE